MSSFVGRITLIGAIVVLLLGAAATVVVMPRQVELTCTRTPSVVRCESVETMMFGEDRLKTEVDLGQSLPAWVTHNSPPDVEPERIRVRVESHFGAGPSGRAAAFRPLYSTLEIGPARRDATTPVTHGYPTGHNILFVAQDLNAQLDHGSRGAVTYDTKLGGATYFALVLVVSGIMLYIWSLRLFVVYDPDSGRVVATTRWWLSQPVVQVDVTRAEIADVVVTKVGSQYIPAFRLGDGRVRRLAEYGLRFPGRANKQARQLRALLELPHDTAPEPVRAS